MSASGCTQTYSLILYTNKTPTYRVSFFTLIQRKLMESLYINTMSTYVSLWTLFTLIQCALMEFLNTNTTSTYAHLRTLFTLFHHKLTVSLYIVLQVQFPTQDVIIRVPCVLYQVIQLVKVGVSLL